MIYTTATETRTYPHGVPCWVDVTAHDVDEARRFYTGLFDWTFEDAVPADVPGSYPTATMGGHVDHWQVAFSIADRDESATLAESLGGTISSSHDAEWTKTAVVRSSC